MRWGFKLGHPLAETKPVQVKLDQAEDIVQDDLFRAAPGKGKKPHTTEKPPESGEHEGSGDNNSNSSESIEETAEVQKTQSDSANRNAFYHFQSVVKDGIKDGQVERHETRQGLKVVYIKKNASRERLFSQIAP